MVHTEIQVIDCAKCPFGLKNPERDMTPDVCLHPEGTSWIEYKKGEVPSWCPLREKQTVIKLKQ